MEFKIPTSKDIQKLTPNQRQMLRITTGRRIREPVPAKRQKEVLERAKNKCEAKRCRVHNNDIKLIFHHINLKRDDNRLKNIMALCPNHHQKIHKIIKRKVEKDVLGREIKSRLIKKKK